MGTPKRPTKPIAERTDPIRSWSRFAPSSERPATAPRSPPDTGDSGEAEPEGAAGGVASGYRVIDDYLSQGREAAAKLGFGTPEGWGAGSFQSLTARLFQDGLLWLEYLSKLAAVPEAGANAGTAGEVRGPGGNGEGRLRVRVASRTPAEVDLQLHAPTAPGSYGVHALHSPDPAAPPIDDVRLEHHGGSWLLTVRVADQQPDGLYTGVVFDRRDGSVQGTLGVRVGDDGPTA